MIKEEAPLHATPGVVPAKLEDAKPPPVCSIAE